MAEYHAGTLNAKNKNLWRSKTECTDEAIDSIRDYMVQELLGGFDCRKAVSCKYEWTLKDGRVVELRVTIKQPAKGDDTTITVKQICCD